MQKIKLAVFQRCPYDRHLSGDSPGGSPNFSAMDFSVLEPVGTPDKDARSVEKS